MRCHRSRIFLLLFYSFAVFSILASNRLDAASLQLTWLDNSQNEDGFHIERKLGTNGTFSLIATVGPNVASYSDDNLADSTTYCYRVNAFNGAGSSAYTNQACGTTSAIPAPPPPPSSPVTATLLGQTGEDIAGTTAESPDGIQDVHIRLSGVQGTIVRVRIADNGGGVWETPSNGWWIVAIRPRIDPSLVDLYFDFWQPASSYPVNLTFASGSTQTIQTSVGTPTPPPPSANTISMNIANGALLSGSSIAWTATPSGFPVRVEFFVDGALSWTENTSPYQFNGDPSGTLNTNTLSNGSHQLKVRATYSGNSTAEQTVTVTVSNSATPSLPPPPVSSPVTATLLGQTGEDIAGTTSESPDGIRDVHIRLSGVQSAITRVRITDDGSGVWETPYNGWWIVAIRPQTNASLVDLYFDFWQSTSTYTLNMAFANGTTQTIQISGAASTSPPPPVSSTIAATLLGQTGVDIAGTTSESPDGIRDVHIRLSGVQSAITTVRITDDGSGVWETPYNDWWIVAIRPHTDPSLVDLYFDFWQPSSSYTLNLALANGTTQTIQTSAALSLQLLGNSP